MIRLHFDDVKISNVTNNKLSWLVCARKYLISKTYDYTTPKDIYVYLHHFPLSLLNWRTNHPKIQMSTLIEINQAKDIATNDLDNRRLMEYTHSMYYMLKILAVTNMTSQIFLLLTRRVGSTNHP